MSHLFLFLLGSLLIVTLFIAGWWWSVQHDFYAIVDLLWSFSIGVLAVFWVFGLVILPPFHQWGSFQIIMGGVLTMKQLLVSAFILFWSGRLGFHLLKRLQKKYPHEDPRYKVLKERWKGHEKSAFFGFFQLQAFSVILLALPFFTIGSTTHTAFSGSLSWLDNIGILVTVIGIIGELIADAQLADFKKGHPSSTEVCQIGLWYYSRHPNYFFEIMIWLGFYLLAFSAPLGWIFFYAPLGIGLLICCVTGIPPAEATALVRKGEAYRAYQRRTSPLIPWFPKKG